MEKETFKKGDKIKTPCGNSAKSKNPRFKRGTFLSYGVKNKNIIWFKHNVTDKTLKRYAREVFLDIP